jgi:flagellar biosynthetic protein FliR
MEIYVGQFIVFLMLFARATAMVVVAPVIGHQNVPVQIKAGVGLFLAFVMYPLAAGKANVVSADFIPLVVVALKEIAAGLTIGFAAGLIFAGVRFAGDLISMDTSLSMAAMFDPEQNAQTSVLTEFLYLFLLMIFLLLNGHHFVFEALEMSYVAVPLGAMTFSGDASQVLIKLTGFMFIVAVKLAAPIIVSMFLVNVALSILSRVMPQMNIFAVAFPIKLAVGFAGLMVSAPMIVYAFKTLLAGFQANMLDLIKAM